MMNLLIRRFIKNYDDVQNPTVRQAYGTLGSCFGIACNLVLFLGKLFVGVLTGAISIMADAFNNLSDAGSSLVTLIGFKLAGKPANKEHPFGHGRVEYLSGLFIASAIMLVGVELAKSSVDKILHPEELNYSIWSILILAVSIGVKLYMALVNRTIGEKIQSSAMKATATDSLSDCIATTAVLISIIVGYFTNLKIDGIVGVLVSIFIFMAGVQTMKDTIQPLLGQPPEPEFVKGVQDIILAHEEIVGIHDMVVHDYGPGRVMVSLHAEIPKDMDFMQAHDVIDDVEREVKNEFHCDITIHMDPIAVHDEKVEQMKRQVVEIVKKIDEKMTIHDFRMTSGPKHTNLIFDVVVPFETKMTDNEVREAILRGVQKLDGNYYAVVEIDKSFV